MDLNTVWFGLIAVLFIGFFVLEGFDYGVGILLPFLGRDDDERRVVINSIGPFWDGNEVWMITAGGAMFAAFPHWYATLFSGFYLALVLMLLALIGRGVAFEFRGTRDEHRWRRRWDTALFLGSVIPAFLWGVALANIFRGVPIDAQKNYVGGFFNLLNPYALVGGLLAVSLFAFHGALFLGLKTAGEMSERALGAARKLWIPTVALAVLLLVLGTFTVEAGLASTVAILVAAVVLLMSRLFAVSDSEGRAFLLTSVVIAVSVVSFFVGLYPNVMPSSLDPANSLTIYSASSSPYTLKTMTIVALVFVPIVLAYQIWTYWTFRQRLQVGDELEY